MIPILFRDSAVLVCLKPAGVVSQSSGERDLAQLLSDQEGGRVYPIHRLDRGVGGVMVFARTQAAAAKLSAAIQARKLNKRYLCVVQGRPAKDEGEYRDLLYHDKTRNKTFVVKRMRGGVKEAALDYRVLDATEDQSLVLVHLHTGRTHQIRVQFASRGTPLAGDGKYGGGPGELSLWSYCLSFPHPSTGKTMAFTQLPSGGVWDKFPISQLL